MTSLVVKGSARMALAGAVSLGLPIAEQDAAASVADSSAQEDIGKACATQNFDSFVEIFVSSPEIRQAYSSPTIAYTLRGGDHRVLSTRKISAKDYTMFPIRVDGVRWYSADESGDKSAGSTPINVKVHDDLDTISTIDWTRTPGDTQRRQSDPSGDQSDSGPDGRLVFKAGKGCWLLSEDIRFVKQG
jgi:hypothetical protein